MKKLFLSIVLLFACFGAFAQLKVGGDVSVCGFLQKDYRAAYGACPNFSIFASYPFYDNFYAAADLDLKVGKGPKVYSEYNYYTGTFVESYNCFDFCVNAGYRYKINSMFTLEGELGGGLFFFSQQLTGIGRKPYNGFLLDSQIKFSYALPSNFAVYAKLKFNALFGIQTYTEFGLGASYKF